MATEITLFILLVTSSAVALIAKRLNLPYTVTLVVAGIGLGAIAPHVATLLRAMRGHEGCSVALR